MKPALVLMHVNDEQVFQQKEAFVYRVEWARDNEWPVYYVSHFEGFQTDFFDQHKFITRIKENPKLDNNLFAQFFETKYRLLRDGVEGVFLGGQTKGVCLAEFKNVALCLPSYIYSDDDFRNYKELYGDIYKTRLPVRILEDISI